MDAGACGTNEHTEIHDCISRSLMVKFQAAYLLVAIKALAVFWKVFQVIYLRTPLSFHIFNYKSSKLKDCKFEPEIGTQRYQLIVEVKVCAVNVLIWAPVSYKEEASRSF